MNKIYFFSILLKDCYSYNPLLYNSYPPNNFYQYNSYGDWFEDLYQNGEWDTYDDDNWPDVSESSAQWQDYETGV